MAIHSITLVSVVSIGTCPALAQIVTGSNLEMTILLFSQISLLSWTGMLSRSCCHPEKNEKVYYDMMHLDLLSK
jgi:hypothetical protein